MAQIKFVVCMDISKKLYLVILMPVLGQAREPITKAEED
jgi:hypothetical protein